MVSKVTARAETTAMAGRARKRKGKAESTDGFGVLSLEELHGDGGKGEDGNHHGKHGEIAENFAEDISEFGNWSGSENLAHAGFAVSLNGIFDEIKSCQGEKDASNEREKGADPSGIVDATHVVYGQGDSADRSEIAEIDSESESNQKAVTANAFKEVGPGERERACGKDSCGALNDRVTLGGDMGEIGIFKGWFKKSGLRQGRRAGDYANVDAVARCAVLLTRCCC